MAHRKSLEDTEGMREYNLQNSVRIITHNPDMINTQIVSCACGLLIDRKTEWHVMIANGMLLCQGCAFCSCCRRENTQANRRLVCIDGLVLCYNCLENFGYFKDPALKVKVDSRAKDFDEPGNKNNAKGKEVLDVLKELRRLDRSSFLPKVDKRRPIRKAYYDRQSTRLPDSRNPLIIAPVYDATKGRMDKMVCPTCTKLATGPGKYVVAASARVYHKPCVVCVTCKEPMNMGMQMAGKNFEFCTCEPVQMWCTRSACKQLRLKHHEDVGCWLGSLRPGGRNQCDTVLSAQFEKNGPAKTDGKKNVA